ncbi:MAG: hypothetical protein L3J47_08230 [Sulfurovum sp.]|nr:hypothetical protein [Sulfurovum sp.]
MTRKHFSFLLLFVSLILFSGCEGPSPLSGKVKKEYFTNGQIRSEFIMSDNTGKNGLLKKYGPDGKVTSTVPIRNGVKNGVEKLYDEEGRVLKTTPYYMGKKHGDEKGYFPSGDVWFVLPYRNGVLNGNAYIYRQDGTVVRKGIYRKGRLVN